MVVLFGLRACGGRAGSGYTVIYSNLDLKDSAQVADRLKELRIPYEIKDEGQSIAVTKDMADEARLGLAIKGLPQGGVVGFEIFDETRFGATDFDKRIQLIRALSGELSRTISRIDGVENARVQIVVPKTELFATEKLPVTASVMLRFYPKKQLSGEQVRGIIHLVSSSVEGLQPQNVTVIDNFGHIISDLEYVSEISKVEEIKKVAETATKESAHEMTPEEILKLEFKAKQEFEEQLARRAQLVLNKFYPPNTVIVKVNVELGPAFRTEAGAQVTLGSLERISVVVLVDNRFEFAQDLKKSTMQAVAAAVGYDRRRGDQIIVNRVPFHLASALPEETLPPQKKETKISIKLVVVAGVGILVLLGLIWFSVRRFFGAAKPPAILKEKPEPLESARELDSARRIALSDPGRLAELVKSWIAEETSKTGE
jgi:flagellar M-ring protein FliF